MNLWWSSPPGKYYIATMTMITASTSLTIFIMNIHFCGAEAKPVPHWAKVLIIDYMSKIFFVYEVGENCTTPESEKEPANNDHFPDYPDGGDPYEYSNGHGSHANGNANNSRHQYSSRAAGPERGESERGHPAPPHPPNLRHLNGGPKEQLLYPAAKLQLPACPCRCPGLQHRQVRPPRHL